MAGSIPEQPGRGQPTGGAECSTAIPHTGHPLWPGQGSDTTAPAVGKRHHSSPASGDGSEWRPRGKPGMLRNRARSGIFHDKPNAGITGAPQPIQPDTASWPPVRGCRSGHKQSARGLPGWVECRFEAPRGNDKSLSIRDNRPDETPSSIRWRQSREKQRPPEAYSPAHEKRKSKSGLPASPRAMGRSEVR